MSSVEVRSIAAEETRPLRRAVLRPHQAVHELVYLGDDASNTLHVGAYLDNELVSVASVYRNALPGTFDEAAWQLRGMATLPQAQGQGIGRKVLQMCLDHVAYHGGRVLWCNARTSAAGFYRAAGFAVHGEEFDVPDIGLHIVMWRRAG